MLDTIDNSNNFLTSYIEENRVKIDEALVSLRLMKEVDDFLDVNYISQRDFAKNIGYSEAFVSQLMSGTKKFNASFINRFEKIYDLKIDFKIKTKKESDFISKMSNSSIEININFIALIESKNIFSFENNPSEFSEFNSDLLKLEI
ncbi:MAG: helix-turn-helix transcriptional regulator [Lutibacter sp.]